MRIAWVSSWPPRHCGIATYSQELVTALRRLKNKVMVICHHDGGKKREEDVYPVINLSQAGWNETLYRQVNKLNPEALHIQHEFGLYTQVNDYGAGLLPALYRWQIEQRFPLVMTYHSVYTSLSRPERYYLDASLNLINAGVVHENHQWAYLPQNLGRIPRNVYVIHHGAKNVHRYPRAKEDFGLKNKKVLGMIGWWNRFKGFDRVVRMWDGIKKEVPSAYLLIAGDARPGSLEGQNYKTLLLKAVENCRQRKSIKVLTGNFRPNQYDKILCAFDLIVLPYNKTSQSGNLAHAFALGIPAVASSLEGVKAQIEESKAGMTVPAGDDEELKRVIIALLKDDKLRTNFARNAKKFVNREIQWSIIAQKHLRLYTRLREEMQGETVPPGPPSL